jgi:hypothetical protein
MKFIKMRININRIFRIRWFWWKTLRGGDHLEDPGADGRIIYTWIFRKRDVGA